MSFHHFFKTDSVLKPRPSLNLQFAKNKNLIDSANGATVSFVRATSGTYVDSDGLIKTATSGTPRFDHDPLTGVCNGVLVEQASTNLTINSESTTSWSAATFFTYVDNQTTAPDGQSTADLIQETADNGQHVATKSIVLSTLAQYTASIFVKGKNRRYFQFGHRTVASWTGGNPAAVFDLQDGVITATGPSTTARMKNYGNGWWRCEVTANLVTSGSGLGFRILGNTNGSFANSYLGDVNNGYYVWGSQYEQLPVSTSYIATGAATVTRNADVLSISGASFTNFFNSEEYSAVVRGKINPIGSSVTNSGAGYPYLFSVHRSDLIQRLAIMRSAGVNNGSPTCYSEPPSTLCYTSTFNYNTGTEITSGATYTASPAVYKSHAGGENGTSLTPGVTASNFAEALIGSGTDGGYWNGTIGYVTVYKKALSDAIMRRLTR